MSVAEEVRMTFKRLPAGGVIASAQLRHLSEDSKQVDKAVSRIFKDEGLKKLRNGLYYKPLISQYFGPLSPKDTSILKSLKTQYSAKLVPSGALAAYELGFVHQAPEEKIYNTNKRIAAIRTDNTKISFRQVQSKKLFLVNVKLATLLSALEFLYKEYSELNYLQQQLVKRHLKQYPNQDIEKALTHWPKWFRCKVMALIKSKNNECYITGVSAFNIPYQGRLSDWHQIGMLSSNKFQIAGLNYQAAPDLNNDELFDCSDFLSQHQLDLPLRWCAKPERVIKDILYSNIMLKNQYPYFFRLDQYMLPLSGQAIKICIDEIRPYANEAKMKLLDQWLLENDIH